MGRLNVARKDTQDITSELQKEIEVLGKLNDDFNQKCAKLENNLLKRVFRVVLGKKKLVLADYKKFNIVSLEGQPNRYKIFLKGYPKPLGEVTKTYSDAKGFRCEFIPENQKDEKAQ